MATLITCHLSGASLHNTKLHSGAATQAQSAMGLFSGKFAVKA
jgi:hypothetical protein